MYQTYIYVCSPLSQNHFVIHTLSNRSSSMRASYARFLSLSLLPTPTLSLSFPRPPLTLFSHTLSLALSLSPSLSSLTISIPLSFVRASLVRGAMKNKNHFKEGIRISSGWYFFPPPSSFICTDASRKIVATFLKSCSISLCTPQFFAYI